MSEVLTDEEAVEMLKTGKLDPKPLEMFASLQLSDGSSAKLYAVSLDVILATARREGAEQMRERAAQWVSENDGMVVGNYLAKTIRALPLEPDRPR